MSNEVNKYTEQINVDVFLDKKKLETTFVISNFLLRTLYSELGTPNSKLLSLLVLRIAVAIAGIAVAITIAIFTAITVTIAIGTIGGYFLNIDTV